MTFEEYWNSLNKHYPFRDDYQCDIDIRNAFRDGYKSGMERCLELVKTKGPIPINIADAIQQEI